MPQYYFLSQDCLAIGIFSFSIQIKIFSSSTKNTIGNLIGITLNLYIALGSMVILTIVILPIQEYTIFFHLFVFFDFFHQCHSFWSTNLLLP